jgi:sugar lactone lactonase YvrE
VTILALCPSATAQPEFIELIAGLGVPGNQPALTSNLGAVGGVAVDPAGNIYISLSNYGIVEKLDTAGTLSRFAGTGTPGFSGDGGAALLAQFSAPTAIALDGKGNLYIADTGNARVRRIAASTGIVTTVAGGGSQSDSSDAVPATSLALVQLGGLAADSTGEWYFASGCRIRKVGVASGLASIVVGTGVCGFSGDQGPALPAQIGNPGALAVDALGNLYFTDGNRVRAVDARSGIIGTFAGTGNAGFSGDNGAATAAMLSAPASVAVDAQFNVFVADTANQRVRRIDGHSGIITTVAGNGTAGSGGDGGPAIAAMLNTPKSIALDASGNLTIADTGNGLIRRVSASSGIISTVAGSGVSSFSGDAGPAATAQFAKLRGVALDSSGNVYLADTGNCRVRRIVASTGYVSTVAGSGAAGPSCGLFAGDNGPATEARLDAPGDVAVDSNGNLFIADTGNARIRKVDVSSGIITTVAGGGTVDAGSDGGLATAAKLVSPGGLAVDGSGDVLFSDTGGNRVRSVSAGGIITTLAGNGQAGFSGDNGPATAAMLNGPAGIALDSTGNLYIADNGNNRVRRVAQGTINTVAGNGQSGFSGDAGPATGAALASPRGVGVDTAGNLWIADEANNRIRMVSSSTGIITTIAGDGTQNSSGDGGLASAAEVDLPWGLAISASDQTVYFSENGSSRLRALVPPGAALNCSIVAIIPSTVGVVASGASVPVQLLSSSLSCGWSVSGLPDWISAFPSSGAGSATVDLRIAANAGAARTAAINVARTAVQVTQAAVSPGCAYGVSPLVVGAAASGESGSFSVVTAAGCSWQVAGAPSWLSLSGATSGSGPGTVPFTIAANTGSRRSASFTVAGQTVIVSQNGGAYSAVGTFPHFASGGGWQTAFTLVNTGYGPSTGYLNFYDEKGTSLLPAERAGDFSPLPPAGLQSVATPGGSDTNPLQGWAQLVTNGNVNGYEIFRLATTQGYLEALTLPETRVLSSYMLPFDTTGGHDYGLALVNSSEMDGFVNVSATDATTGALLFSGSSLPLASQNHTSFVLTAQYPALANTRGVLRLSTFFAGQANVLGLRLKPGQSLTSVPVFAVSSSTAFNGFVDAGILPQVVSGGGWSTTFVLVNTGGATAKAHLDFYDDQGAPLSLVLSQLVVGATVTAAGADATLLPGTMATIVVAGNQTAQSGWAHLLAEGNVGAYALLSYSDSSSTRETIAPVATPAANADLLPFDNTNGYGNGVALANNSAQPASVLVIVRDASGQSLYTETIGLPAWGHLSFGISARYPVTVNSSGTLEFSSPVSGEIGVLGIRAGSNDSLTAVPALARQ